MNTEFKIDKVYGFSELIPIMLFAGDRVLLGGICREYDKNGDLVKENVRVNMEVTFERAF